MKTYRHANGTLDYKTLKTTSCSDSQISSDFFPVNPRYEKEVEFNMAKLKCLQNVDDPEPLPGLKPRYDSPTPVYGTYD